MRVIARRTLQQFVDSLAGHQDQPAVKAALDAWFDEAHKARWASTADIKRRYATASIVTAERIVFNIKGNAYRLAVAGATPQQRLLPPGISRCALPSLDREEI